MFSGLDQRSTVLYIFIALSAFGTLFFLLLRSSNTNSRKKVGIIIPIFYRKLTMCVVWLYFYLSQTPERTEREISIWFLNLLGSKSWRKFWRSHCKSSRVRKILIFHITMYKKTPAEPAIGRHGFDSRWGVQSTFRDVANNSKRWSKLVKMELIFANNWRSKLVKFGQSLR